MVVDDEQKVKCRWSFENHETMKLMKPLPSDTEIFWYLSIMIISESIPPPKLSENYASRNTSRYILKFWCH